MRILKGHRGKLRAVVYSPDGSKLATAGDDGLTKLWEVVSGRELGTIHQPGEPKQTVRSLAFSPDSGLLATGANEVRVWSVATLAEVPLPAGLGHSLGLALAFTPDGSLLLVSRWYGRDKWDNVVAWDRGAGAITTPFRVVRNAIPADLTVSASANLLATALADSYTGGRGHYVGLWQLDSKAEAGELDHSKEAMPSFQAIAIAPDGRTLAVTGGPRAFIWDLPARQLRGRLEGHANQINAVAFSPDSDRIATASHDGTVRLWDVQTLRQQAVFDWETGKVRCVAFSPDGMTVAAAGERRKVVIWDVE